MGRLINLICKPVLQPAETIDKPFFVGYALYRGSLIQDAQCAEIHSESVYVPKNAIRSGEVEEIVTQRRVIPEGEESPGDGMDAFEYMESVKPDDWSNHIVYIYRTEPAGSSGFIDKFSHPFDEAYLKENFGGGSYSYHIKKGSQRVKAGRIRVVGPPKDPSQMPSAPSDLVQAIKLVMEKNGANGTSAATELTAIAFKNALEIQRASMPPPMSIADLTTALKNLNELNGGAPKSSTPEWLAKLGDALIPAGAALLMKMLEPKDALQSITSVVQAMQALKGATGETAAPDMGIELMRNGPQLLGGLVNLLGELRKAEELKRIQASAAPALPPGVRAVPPERVDTRQQTPAPAEMPKNGSGEPSPEFVWGHVVDMCRNGDDGVFAFNFLDQIDPQSMATLRGMNLSLDQLKLYIASGEIHPILKERLAPLPGYAKFIAEFYQALMRPAVAAA
jgi:hypothetical protein